MNTVYYALSLFDFQTQPVPDVTIRFLKVVGRVDRCLEELILSNFNYPYKNEQHIQEEARDDIVRGALDI